MTTARETFVVDTHALVWYLTDDKKLSAKAASLIEQSERGGVKMVIPTIVLAELLTIVEKKRVPLAMTTVLDWMIACPGVLVSPLDLLVFAEMLRMGQGLELHDRIIAATANQYAVHVITRDPALSAAVRTVW
ncbi:MAG: PIN domain-containing protein [Dehalococcoidia bacterium]|nr:MAG: PIN domain-containing protein [Dehalococcoidia bacterium]